MSASPTDLQTEATESPTRIYRIMVFGAEKVGLAIAANKKEIKYRNLVLCFEPFETAKRFYDFDGVILFNGIFEEFRSSHGHTDHKFDEDALDKRKKELSVLLQKRGFICFLLASSIIDTAEGKTIKGSDLAKYCLNYQAFYRENYPGRQTYMNVTDDSFREFFRFHGAVSTRFRNLNRNLDCHTLARDFGGALVSMIIERCEYFIPALIPDNRPDDIVEFFERLGSALVTSVASRSIALPEWVREFKFKEDQELANKRTALTQEIEKIDARVERLDQYRAILTQTGDELVKSVIAVLTDCLGKKAEQKEEFKEDFKLIDENQKLVLMCEVKGTNGGVKREHINQADTNRERSGFDENFPTLLIVNVKRDARTLQEKDLQIATDQISHAVKTRVLIVRTVDLIWLLNHVLEGSMSRDEALKLLTSSTGWLKVSESGYELVNGGGTAPPTTTGGK